MTLKEMKKKSRKQKVNNWVGTIELIFSLLLLFVLVFIWKQIDLPLLVMLIVGGVIGIITAAQLMGNNPLTDKLKEEQEEQEKEELLNEE